MAIQRTTLSELYSGLRLAEEFLGTVPAGFIELDLSRKVFDYLSPEIARCMGYLPEELLSMSADELVDIFPRGPQSDSGEYEFDQSLVETETTEADWEVLHRDGRTLYFRMGLRVLERDEEGAPVRVGGFVTEHSDHILSLKMLGSMVDEAGRKTMGTDRLEFHLRLLAETLGTSHALVALANADRTEASTVLVLIDGQISPNFEYRIEGSPCAEVLRRHICCYPRAVATLFPEDRSLAEMHLQSYLGVRLYDREGHAIGHLVAMDRKPMPDLLFRRAVISLLGKRIAEDIGLMRAETERKAAESQLSRVLASLSEGVALIDPNGQAIWSNSRSSEILGIDFDHHPCLREGRCCWALLELDGTDLVNEQSPVVKALATRGPVRCTVGRKHPEGHLQWLNVFVRPHLTSESGEVNQLLCTFTDVTEEKERADEDRRFSDRLEQTVRERTAELQSSNRDLETLCYSVSHDLRGPIRAIDANCHFIAEELGGGASLGMVTSLATVRRSAKKMGQLIDQLLAFTRLSRSKMAPDWIDLSAAAGAFRQHRSAMQLERIVFWNIEPGLRAYGDPMLLSLALENLLDNAWKYTSRTNEATIDFGFDEAIQAFFVRDNGVGFDPAYAYKLFMPFERLHADTDFSGIGVGLAIVNRIFERHGGRVWLEGRPGDGATAFFTIPAPKV